MKYIYVGYSHDTNDTANVNAIPVVYIVYLLHYMIEGEYT